MPSPANNLHALRIARGLTLRAFAELVGTTNQQISHLELGRRRLSVDWLVRLAAALKCEPAEIFSPSAVVTDEGREVLRLFGDLDEEGRQAVLGYIGLLADAGAGE